VTIRLGRKAVIAGATAILVLVVGPLVGLSLYFWSLAAGAEIASVPAVPGTPFELSYASSGEEERVWLDVVCVGQCEPNAVEGRVVAVTADGTQLASVWVEEPMSGYSERGVGDELNRVYSTFGHPFMEVPAQPAGTRVFIRGTLVPEPVRIYELGPLRLNAGLPLPTIRSLRIWVAP
jgi:hypothetical protein